MLCALFPACKVQRDTECPLSVRDLTLFAELYIYITRRYVNIDKWFAFGVEVGILHKLQI